MARILDTGVPCVVIDRYYEKLKPLTVDLDDLRGGRLPAELLLKNGHRRIAFACPFRSPSIVVRQRIRGFAQVLREAGVPFPARYFFNSSGSLEDGVRIGRAICAMSDRPTAVVTTLDRLAVGILEGIRLSGYSVPNDISIVGFDNWELLEYVQPKLTTVLQDLERRPNAWSRLFDAPHPRGGDRAAARHAGCTAARAPVRPKNLSRRAVFRLHMRAYSAYIETSPDPKRIRARSFGGWGLLEGFLIGRIGVLLNFDQLLKAHRVELLEVGVPFAVDAAVHDPVRVLGFAVVVDVRGQRGQPLCLLLGIGTDREGRDDVFLIDRILGEA